VSLDGVEEAVRRFVLASAVDPAGSVLEINGRSVAWLVPAAPSPTSWEKAWTEVRNQRRKYTGNLTPPQAVELAQPREELLRYRNRTRALNPNAPA
jgi:hypothetical protein